jgi:4a-hydroxytetrahydrobiopterin dehydratase
MEAMARPAKSSESEIAAALAELPGWEREGDEISRVFECASFPDAIAFVVRIGFLAEQTNHHPDLDVRWRKVRVALTTHDAGGLTALDAEMAAKISTAFTLPPAGAA